MYLLELRPSKNTVTPVLWGFKTCQDGDRCVFLESRPSYLPAKERSLTYLHVSLESRVAAASTML